MKKLFMLAIPSLIVACSSSSSSSAPSVYGTWAYTNASTGAVLGLTVNQDDTYEVQNLVVTSNTTAEDEVEIGVVAISATSLMFTPTKASCIETTTEDPAYTEAYRITGGNLDLTTTSGFLTFSPDTTPAPSNISVTFGCFSATGTFTATPITGLTQ